MNLLTIVIFVHVLGMLGLFVALGLDGLSVVQLRRSRSASELRPWLGLAANTPGFYRASLALIVVTGAYLSHGVIQGTTADVRIPQLGWLTTSVIGMVMLAVTGAMSYRRLRPLWRPVNAVGQAPASLVADAHEPLLFTLWVARTMLAVAIVFLMIARPPLEASLLVLGATVIVALVLGGLTARRGQVADAIT